MTSNPVGQCPQTGGQALDPWSSPSRLAAGHKWRAQAAIMGQGITNALVEVLRVESGMHVLDLASGEGDPALTLAALVGGDGTVVATDINSGLLEIAAQRARENCIPNIQFRVADAQQLPFEDALFDRVTCRFGAMFFPDPVAAMREVRRVLRTTGRVALAAWGLVGQPGFQVFLTPLLRAAGGPMLPSEGPNPFRFAEPGTLSAVLLEAGFRDVQEQAQTVERRWTGSPEELWEYFRDHSAVFAPLIQQVPADKWAHVSDEIVTAIGDFRVGDAFDLPARINLAVATK